MSDKNAAEKRAASLRRWADRERARGNCGMANALLDLSKAVVKLAGQDVEIKRLRVQCDEAITHGQDMAKDLVFWDDYAGEPNVRVLAFRKWMEERGK